MRHLKAVLFDLDGVLIDSYEAWYSLLNAAAREYGFPDIEREKYQLLFGQSVEADVDILFPGMKAEDLSRFFEEHFFDYLDDFNVIPGADETLALVSELGLASAVVTNTTHELADAILKHIGLRPDHLVGAGPHIPGKPAPDMVLAACKGVGVEADSAVLVGDSDFDERASRGAGVFFIGFNHDGDLKAKTHAEVRRLLREEFSLATDNKI